MFLAAFLVVTLTAIAIVIKKLHEINQQFKRDNIKHIKPHLLFGNNLEVFLGKKHASEQIDLLYSTFPDEDIVGHYDFVKNTYVLRNPDIIQQVLIKDFSHFTDRMKSPGPIRNPGDASLFILSGNTWRAVRYKFSPLFTSGKLKYMYGSIKDCGKTLMNLLEKNDGKEVDMSEVSGLFAMDVIGSTAFGIDVNTLENPNSDFRTMGKKLFVMSFLDNLRLLFITYLPKLAYALGISGFFRNRILNYFCNIISDALEHRKKEKLERNDFVQMLLQLKEKGKIEIQVHDKNDDYLKMDDTAETFELELTDDILVGGAFSFLSAGFHATAVTITYTIYELAKRPDIVKKIREEIQEKIKDDNVTYDDLKNLTYLDNVIKESVRMYPAARLVGRVCTKDYTLPNGYKIKTGETVFIPISSIQMDPAYFPDPHVFNPDRFESTPIPGTYLPFGEGPRVCIAMRFAQLEIKFALVKLLSNYDFTLSESSKAPIKLEPRAFLSQPKDPLKFIVKKISKPLTI